MDFSDPRSLRWVSYNPRPWPSSPLSVGEAANKHNLRSIPPPTPLGAALRNKITFTLTDGLVDQANFDTYQPLRMSDMPAVDVHIVKSDQPPTGVGEPGVLPIAPTVSNAIFAATDTRLRSLPFEFNRSGDRLSSTSTREPGGERHARLGSRLSGLAFKEFLDDHRTGGSSPSKRWFRFARPRLETIVRLRHGNQDESEATTTGVVTGRLEKDNKSMRVADFGS
jgi:hypothetical protein